MRSADRTLDWGNILFLTLSPIAAVVGTTYYAANYGVKAWEIALFVVGFFATGISITGGYHRHFSHVSYRAHPLVRLFYLVFGACAMQNSALNWAADHRLHHRFTDTDKDPYNAGQGFWFSHIGWIFYVTPKNRDFTIVGDLLRDKWVVWQHNHTVAIGLTVGLGLPLAIGLLFGRPMGGLLWGGLVRIVFVHHATFFINSLAHMWGSQSYSRSDSSRDSWWLALLTNGEGYHNFHHRFPSDYRNAIHWYQWDPTKWLIAGLNLFGMTTKLHRIPQHLILKARMEVEAMDAEKRLNKMPTEAVVPVRARLIAAQQHFDQALMQWAETKAHYLEAKKTAWRESATRAQWKARLREYETKMESARLQWRDSLRNLEQQPV